MKIEAIIFDFGNVISRVDNDRMIENLLKYTSKSKEEIRKAFYGKGADNSGNVNALAIRHEMGLVSSEDFFEEIKIRCDLQASFEEFCVAYTSKFTKIKTTLDLIKKLKKDYRLGLLSNTGEIDFKYEIKPTEVFPLFDTVTLSFEVGAMKPHGDIYRDALTKLKIKPDKCVFIDDIKDYAEGASRLGIHGIQYTGHEDLILRLRELQIKF